MFPNIKLKIRNILYILIKMIILDIFDVSNANGKDIDPVAAARKDLRPIKFENADPEMIKFKQWVLWRYKLNDKGKLTKVPYSINKAGILYKASPTNSLHWLTFEEAKGAYESGKYEVDGVGFVLTENDPFCCVDFDHVIDPETNEINLIAQEEARAINSKVELSPSGTGWHEIFEGKMPKPGKKKNLEDGSGREMYCSGRYITMTFDVPIGFSSQINYSEPEGLELFKKYWPDVDEPSTTDQKTKSIAPTFEIPEPFVIKPDSPLKDLFPTKDQVMVLCRNAPNGDKFNRVLNGDISEYGYDESKADLALAGMVAFHTSDYGIIKEIIQESALWDEKWERSDYCQRTIMKAIRNRWGRY